MSGIPGRRLIPAALALLLAALLCTPRCADASPFRRNVQLPDPGRFVRSVAIDPSYSITVNTTTLKGASAWVKVSWNIGGTALSRKLRALCLWPTYCSSNDLLALYLPGEGSASQIAPVKFIWTQLASPATWRAGVGSYTFQVLNMRQPLQFVYMRGSWLNSNDLVAQTPNITFSASNTPMHIRLAATASTGQMRATWTTDAKPARPTVRWGTSPGNYSGTATGTSWTYTRSNLCGPPATTIGWVNPGYQSSAVMTGLLPSTRIYYVVGDATLGWSRQFSFLTAPSSSTAAGSPGSTVRLLAAADMGHWQPDGSLEWNPQIQPVLASLNLTIGPGSPLYCAQQNVLTVAAQVGQRGSEWTIKALAAEAASGRYHGFVLNGDISYARGLAAQWETWLHQMRNVLPAMPSMLSIGNHEADWPGPQALYNSTDSGGECGVVYQKRFPLPNGSPPGKVGTYWYSFRLGPITFIQMSSEHPFAKGTPQNAWVRAQLAAVNRTRTPWVVVGLHRMPYVDSQDGQAPGSDQLVAQQLRAAYEGMWFDYSVDMVWYGHEHTYQRSCPLYNYSCVAPNRDGTQRAPVYALFGNAGYDIMPTNWMPTQPAIFSAAQGGVEGLQYGYVRVSANATRLKYQGVNAYTGAVMDTVLLTKPAGWQPKSVTARRAERAALPGGVAPNGTSLSILEDLLTLSTLQYVMSNIRTFVQQTAQYFYSGSKTCKALLDPADDISTPQFSQPFVLNLMNYLQAVIKPNNASNTVLRQLVNFQEQLWTTGRIGQIIASGNGGLSKKKKK